METYKYAIWEEDSPIVICDTLADAEEMVLSIAEGEVYEDYFYEVHRYDTPHNDVIREMMDARDECNERNHVHAMNFKWVREQQWFTWYAWVMNDKGEFYQIIKVPYVGG